MLNTAAYRRYKGIVLGGGGLAVSKGINLLSVMITVPLTLDYLGTERYALWVALSSLITLLSFADLGIGNGLVSAIAKADGEKDMPGIQRLVASGFYLLCGIGLGLLLITFLIYPLVPWNRVFAVKDPLAIYEAGPSMLVFMLFFVVNLPLGVVQRLQMGMQETWLCSLWQAAGNLGAIAGVLMVIHLQAGLPWLVAAMLGIPAFFTAINMAVEFCWRRPQLLPRLMNFQQSTLRSMLQIGMVFFALQVLNILANFSDSLILAHVLDANAVATYGVTFKVYQILLISTLFLQPLWPAFGEALGRHDYAWAKHVLTRILIGSLVLGSLLAMVFYLYGRQAILLWIGSDVLPDQGVVNAFAAWTLLATYGGAISVFLNNVVFLHKQLLIYTIASLVALALKVPLVHMLGTAGVVWATVIGYTVFFSIPAVIIAYRTLTALSARQRLTMA